VRFEEVEGNSQSNAKAKLPHYPACAFLPGGPVPLSAQPRHFQIRANLCQEQREVPALIIRKQPEYPNFSDTEPFLAISDFTG
jgi:hypothetical protein